MVNLSAAYREYSSVSRWSSAPETERYETQSCANGWARVDNSETSEKSFAPDDQSPAAASVLDDSGGSRAQPDPRR